MANPESPPPAEIIPPGQPFIEPAGPGPAPGTAPPVRPGQPFIEPGQPGSPTIAPPGPPDPFVPT